MTPACPRVNPIVPTFSHACSPAVVASKSNLVFPLSSQVVAASGKFFTEDDDDSDDVFFSGDGINNAGPYGSEDVVGKVRGLVFMRLPRKF